MIPVVEIGASLAGDGESVFKSRSSDEGDARAFAFQQSIRGNCSAVANFDRRFRGEGGNLAHGIKDGAAGIVGSRRELEDIDTVADAVDAISECAAGVDGDGEVRGHSTKHIRQGRLVSRPGGTRNETLEFTRNH